MRSAVFLDRDGVLNKAIVSEEGLPLPPRLPAEFEIPTGVPEACSMLRKAGLLLICVTNQPDIARGTADLDLVHWVNTQVRHMCGLEDVLVCPHDDSDHCDCRKPKPGLIFRGARSFNVDLAKSFMIGDRYRDVEAGKAAGLRTVLIDYGYPERAPQQAPDFVASSFVEAVDWIMRQL